MKKKQRAGGLLVVLFWVTLWQLLSMLIGMPLLLPGPMTTASALIKLFGQMDFWFSLLHSAVRLMAGFLCAVFLGGLLAAVTARFPIADAFLAPVRTFLRSTPVSSIIILVLLWLDADNVPFLIAMMTAMPIIWQNLQQGIEGVDSKLLEMASAYGLGRWRTLRHVTLPSALPHFYSGCATAIGFAWKAGIAAEVIARPYYSIGRNLQDAKVYLDTEELFAWTLAVLLISLLVEHALKALTNRGKEGTGVAAT